MDLKCKFLFIIMTGECIFYDVLSRQLNAFLKVIVKC